MLTLQVIGRLGADAAYKEWNGRRFLTFDLAVSEKHKNAEGVPVERTTWVSCTRDGERGVDAYLKKGQQLYVDGDAVVRSYVSKDGRASAALSCRVRTVELLGARLDAAAQTDQTAATQTQTAQYTAQTAAAPTLTAPNCGVIDSNMPF